MRAAIYHGNRDVRIETVDEGEVGPTDVRVDIAACGICGTDLHEYAAGPIDTPGDAPHPITGQTVPIRFGHEFGGRVSAVGDDVTEFEAGDLVTINPLLTCGECRSCIEGVYNRCDNIGTIGLSGGGGGFAESLVLDESFVVPVPESVPDEYTALVEPLAVGVHAVRESEFALGDDVAVVGCGPIGLATIIAAKAAGAGTIVASASRDSRREIAAALGADVTVDPHAEDPVEAIREATDGGAEVVYEVAGSEQSLSQSAEAAVRGGCVTVISLFEEEPEFDANSIVHGELTVHGTFAYTAGPLARREYETVIDLLADGTIDPDPMITDRIDLDDIVDDGFEQLLDRESGQVKILVRP